MAKPNPSARLSLTLALTMPMSLPEASNRPPPELPGEMAASVWTRVMVWPSTSMVRLVAEMIPAVAVPLSSPRGLPMAMTSLPTVNVVESPTMAGVRPVASILMMAMSFLSSVPTMVAS